MDYINFIQVINNYKCHVYRNKISRQQITIRIVQAELNQKHIIVKNEKCDCEMEVQLKK